MASRSSFWFSSSIAMSVVRTPSTDLAVTNLAFCSPSDFRSFNVSSATHGCDHVYANIGSSLVLSVSAHHGVEPGCIALNGIHRQQAKVSIGDKLTLTRFVPPEGFNLVLLTLELEFVTKGIKNQQVDAIHCAHDIRKRFINQVMTVGQIVTFELYGTNYKYTVTQANVADAHDKSSGSDERGILSDHTYIIFESSPSSGIKIINQSKNLGSNIFRKKEFDLQALGIGGLGNEFSNIFRRAFASRVLPPHVINKLGMKHVKGMLLYGPPGTGKTLIARQIGKMLNGKEPKIVNGPEVLSKFVGETEKNVRDLFADAEYDQKTKGDQSELHVIIFDEIDAICKSRGSTRDNTGVHDGIVNTLLTKIDGVESLNNVLLIGMTNRKDLIEEAMLRPGRLDVQVEISLPDEKGRLEILQIHTKKMSENSFLSPDVNLIELAGRTKNYSGAELEGVVKSAVSFALNRQLSTDDLTKPVDEESIRVSMDDFLNALVEVPPAFGASMDDLNRCRVNGIVDCGSRHAEIYRKSMLLVEQVRNSKKSSLITLLLEGPTGTGKTSLAATIGIDSDFPFVKMVTAKAMVGLSEASKCAQIAKVFEDAYKSQLSIIILDRIESLLDYVVIGPRFSNLIFQTLLSFLDHLPPKGRKVMVIGTTSEIEFLEYSHLLRAFNESYNVPTLDTCDVRKVLEHMDVFRSEDLDVVADALVDVPVKKLYQVVEMAAQGREGGDAEAIYSGTSKIDVTHFFDCHRSVPRY